MDFFSKLGETLSEAGKDVSQKAKDLTGLAKLNLDVRSKEEYVQHQYEEIGRQYYQMHKDDIEPVLGEISLIRDALEEIEQLRREIAELKGLKRCPSCGIAMDMEAVFCTKCGTRYDSVFEEEDMAAVPAEAAEEKTGE